MEPRIFSIVLIINNLAASGSSGPFGHPLGGGDGAHGANQATEVATHAFGADQLRPAGHRVKDQGLVAAIGTGNGAAAAADAFLRVKFGIHHGVAVQVGREPELRQAFAHQVRQILHAPIGHIVLQAGHQGRPPGPR